MQEHHAWADGKEGEGMKTLRFNVHHADSAAEKKETKVPNRELMSI